MITLTLLCSSLCSKAYRPGFYSGAEARSPDETRPIHTPSQAAWFESAARALEESGLALQGPRYRNHLPGTRTWVDSAKAVAEFVRSFSRSADPRFMDVDFRAALTRSLQSWGYPFSLIILVQQTGARGENFHIRRLNGAVGIQVSVAGQNSLYLEEGEGNILLRIFPVQVNQESVEYRGYFDDSTGDDSDSLSEPGLDFFFRTGSEMEFNFRGNGFFRYLQPGIRIAGYLRFDEPGSVRFSGESFVRVRLPVQPDRLLHRVELIPKCRYDLNRRNVRSIVNSLGELADLFERDDTAFSCQIGLSFQLRDY